MRRHFLAFLGLATLVCGGGAGSAADLPSAVASPLAGITFDDPPIALPDGKNFQVAMQTAARELGLSCRNIESYGWRMQQSEQARVETIFSTTVGRLRALGYQVEARQPTSVAPDITVFTAHRPDKELLAMWSAGELGLVLLMCDAPPNMDHGTAVGFMAPKRKESGGRNFMAAGGLAPTRGFAPVGTWQGTFTCARGISGGTLKITAVRGGRAEGVFQFYPTRGSTDIPSGSYFVAGDYDSAGNRVQLTPGNWIRRPKDFEAASISGSFDPVRNQFSGVFMDVVGCTSFEAHRSGKPSPEVRQKAVVKASKPRKERAVAPDAAASEDKAVPEVKPEVKGTAMEPLPPVRPEPAVEAPPVAAVPPKPAVVAPKVEALAPKPKPEAVPKPRTDALSPPDSLGAPPPLVEKPALAMPPVPTIDAPPMPAPPDSLPDPPAPR